MGNQQIREQRWYRCNSDNAAGIKIGMAAVFIGKDYHVITNRPVFVDPRDPKARQRAFLQGESIGDNCVVFNMLNIEPPYGPPYYEINLKFPRWAKLGRQSENKPFDIRSKSGGSGYCYLRVQPGQPFESVYLRFDGKIYKLSVKENADCIKVFLWANPNDIPKCLKRG